MYQFKMLAPLETMDRISRQFLCDNFDEVLERVDKEDIGFVILDEEGKDGQVLCPARWMDYCFDDDFGCIINSALRYSINRHMLRNRILDRDCSKVQSDFRRYRKNHFTRLWCHSKNAYLLHQHCQGKFKMTFYEITVQDTVLIKTARKTQKSRLFFNDYNKANQKASSAVCFFYLVAMKRA